MQITKNLAVGAAALVMAAMTACNNNDNKPIELINTYNFETADSFTPQGYWAEVYNTSDDYRLLFMMPDLKLTHQATVDVYDGVEYKSWFGFCPSRSTDTADQPDGNWTDHQWGNITGKGVANSVDYVLACWKTDEEQNGVLAGDDVSVGAGFNAPAVPIAVYVTNSTWGYWAMKNGTAFNRAFGPEDWCKIIFKGVRNGSLTGIVEFYLAKDGNIVNDWRMVDLTPLGEVDYFYAQMQSSDTGAWGMNNPAYFCIDNLSIQYAVYPNPD